jgi:transcriptional regulator with XRE-family HTH domain
MIKDRTQGVEDVLKKFGVRVRELRRDMGLTQTAFAEQCGLHRTYINTVEHGRRNTTLRNLAIIAHALRVPLSKLLEEDESHGASPIEVRRRKRAGDEAG